MADRILLYHATDRNFQAHNFSFADVAADTWSPNFTTCGGAAWRYPYIYFLDTAVSPNVVRVWEHEEGESRSRETARDITLNGTTDAYRGIAITDTHLVACNKTQKRLEYYLLSTKAYDATKNITFTSTSSELEGLTRGGDHLFVVDNGDNTIYKRTLAGAAVSSFTYNQAITMHTIFATTDRLVGIHRNSGATNFWDFAGVVQANPPMFGSGAWEGSYVTFDVEEPNAPTSPFLTATSQTELQMQWTLSTDDGGTPITGHQVRIVAGTSIPANTQWVDTGSTDTEHMFTGLTPGTQYTAQVRAVNAVGPGTASASTSLSTMDRTMPEPEPEPMPPSVSDVPMGLEVELAPTTALVKWKAPTNGASLQGYEISYAEGSSPGTKWIPTESLSTRFFVKGLKRGTQYTWQVRGITNNGAGDASSPLTERTPIASLHNALFFKEFIHTGERVTVHGSPTEIVRAVVDNDDNTFSNETDYAINISRDTQPTRVDAVFIKSKGVTRHSGTPTGGNGTGWTNVDLSATVSNWEGSDVNTTVLGFQHHLMLLDSHFTATNVRVRFQGTNIEIYQILLLEFIMEIDANGDFVEINPDYVDRSAVIHTSPNGGIRRSSPLGSGRSKWETNFVVKVVPGKTVLESVDEFVYLMSENPNIVFSQEFSRYPARVYPASFLLTRIPTRLRSDNKSLGDVVQFRVGEQ